MRTPIDKWNLELIKPGYPWQVIEGDGVTCLLLRQKQIVEKEIKTLEGVYLDGFRWALNEISSRKYLYSGELGLSVRYRVHDISGDRLEYEDESEDEAICRTALTNRNLFRNLKEKEQEPPQLDNSISSSFPSLLLDRANKSENINESMIAENIWKLNIPWQANLNCGGQCKEPRIAKIHVAQVGLRTILLEVLLEVAADEKIVTESFGEESPLIYQGEATLYLETDDIQEVLRVVQKRGFYRSIADIEEKRLLLINALNTSIIYVSAITGGERILAASFISKEESKITGMSALLFPPVGFIQTGQEVKYKLVDKNKLVCRYKQQCDIIQKYIAPENKALNKAISIGETKQKGQKFVDPFKASRKKPCEKWMKKTEAVKAEKNEYKLFLTVKK